MKIKHKSFSLHEIKTDDEARTVEGWASTFGNKDSGDDIIVSGAFAESLTVRKPKMLWQHNSDELIGMWDAATETDKGLYVKGRFADTPRGNEAYTLAKMGALDSMSIGYSTVDAHYDMATGVRTLKKLDLWEVSLVTFPMNDRATITTVKSAADDIDAAYDLLEQAAGICDAYTSGDMEPTAEMLGTVAQLVQQAMGLLGEGVTDPDDAGDGKSRPTPKSIERLLREAGLTRSQAKGVLAKGYTAIVAPREAGGHELERLCELFNNIQ